MAKEASNAHNLFNKRVDGLIASLAYDATTHLIQQNCTRIAHSTANLHRRIIIESQLIIRNSTLRKHSLSSNQT